jgi:ribosomal protein L20
MPRVKRGTISVKRRKNVLKKTKGFRHGRKSKETLARTAIRKGRSTLFPRPKKEKRSIPSYLDYPNERCPSRRW